MAPVCTAPGQEGPKSPETPKCPFTRLSANLTTPSELIAFEALPCPSHSSALGGAIPPKQKLPTVADGRCKLPEQHK